MKNTRQYKEHTRIEILPFALDDPILLVLPGQRKPKMKRTVLQGFFQNIRPLDTLKEMAQPPGSHTFHLFHSVTLCVTRHRNFFFSVIKAHIQIHISIKTNQSERQEKARCLI